MTNIYDFIVNKSIDSYSGYLKLKQSCFFVFLIISLEETRVPASKKQKQTNKKQSSLNIIKE